MYLHDVFFPKENRKMECDNEHRLLVRSGDTGTLVL